jgi:hypothetical protein
MVMKVFLLTKRQKFLLSSFLLSLGLLGIQLVNIEYRYVAIFAFFIATYLVSVWALFDDLKGVEWITLLTLPAMYSGAIGLFYFLLPEATLTRIILVTMFGIGMYALYLTENIYSVAAIRTIQLLRAAHAVGFLMSILVLVLLYNTIYSLHLHFWANGLLVFGVSLPIMLQGLWSINLSEKLSKQVVWLSILSAILFAQLAVVLSFLPATVWIASLFLSTLAYVFLGLLQHLLQERLFQRTVYEYVGVGVLVLAATMLVMPW